MSSKLKKPAKKGATVAPVIVAKTSDKSDVASSSSSEDELTSAKPRASNRFVILDEEDNGHSDGVVEGLLDADDEKGDVLSSEAANEGPRRRKGKKKMHHKAKHDPLKPEFLDKMTEEEVLQYFAAENDVNKASQNAAQESWNPKSTSWKNSAAGEIAPKLLNYRFEFKKTVGKTGMSLPEGVSNSNKSGYRGLVRGVHYLFVNPPPNTPDPVNFADRYIKIEQDPRAANSLVFRRTKKYKELQREFLVMVYTNQDQVVQDVLHQVPFHTDALLLMCSIYERDGNFASARQMIETALLGLQQCFDHQQRNHPQSHRFSYRYPANRSYFITLFKHILLTTSRFPKTALELGKYLFNLSPKDDPLAMILMLDQLALRAREFTYFIAFYHAVNESKNLDMLPNFAFSLPLALFLWRLENGNEVDELAGISAQDRLIEAILRFPQQVPLLYAKMELPMDEKFSRSVLLRSSYNEDNHGLDLLQALYARRSAAFWKEPEVLSWLHVTLTKVVDLANTSDVATKITAYTESRQKSYRGTPSNIWRHILLLNLPDNEPLFQLRLPSDSQRFVFPFDPVPPMNSEERDEWDLREALSFNQSRTAPRAAPATNAIVTGQDTLLERVYDATSLFFRMLFPSTAMEMNVANAENIPGFPSGEVVIGAAVDEEDNGQPWDYLDKISRFYETCNDSTAVKGPLELQPHGQAEKGSSDSE